LVFPREHVGGRAGSRQAALPLPVFQIEPEPISSTYFLAQAPVPKRRCGYGLPGDSACEL